MKYPASGLSLAIVAASLALSGGAARAADPTTADCLGASEASLKSGNEHRLRAERSQLLVCAAASCPADVRKECARRVDDVNTAIPTIIFEVKDGSGKDLTVVKVAMDGEVLAERLAGTALSVDPGEHTFVFETPGQPPVTRQFVVRESQKERRESITIGPVLAGEGGGVGSDKPAGGASGLGAQKVLGIVAAGVGVAGIGVGSVFGVLAMSKKNDAESLCPNRCETSSGVSAWSDAKTAGNVSTVAFVAGGVALAAGAVLWLTAKPQSNGPSAQVGMGPASIQLKGDW